MMKMVMPICHCRKRLREEGEDDLPLPEAAA